MNGYIDLTRAQVDGAFALLAPLLAETPLPVQDYQTAEPDYRTSEVGEFMFMSARHVPGSGLVYGFKHSDTRNYIFVLVPAWNAPPRLHVPRTAEPFQRGGFEVFPMPEEVSA